MSRKPTHGSELTQFLDAASGIPMSDATRRALEVAWRTTSADPRKRYPAARNAKQLLEQSRTSTARALGVAPSQVAFLTGTADAAVALSLKAAIRKQSQRDDFVGVVLLLISPVEEIGVLRLVDAIATTPPGGVKIEVRRIPVDSAGAVRSAAIVGLAEDLPCVVVVQATNGEVGTGQPLAEISELLPTKCSLVVDARHQFGRDPGDAIGDFFVAEPTIWGGPPGITILATANPGRIQGTELTTEGAQGVEAADPPVPLIAAASLSLESSISNQSADAEQTSRLSDQLRASVTDQISDVECLGHPTRRVSYINMFSFLYVAADELVDELARRGWSVASGSACTSDTERPLHVLEAIGALTHGNLRVSLPPWTTADDMYNFVADLVEVVGQIRESAGASAL